jgi:FKBP-type peptidyl-prolyl cis-trans isomerase 2
MVRMGNGMTALVTEVTEEGIVIDCNPQLAGKDLTFDVELVELVKVCHPLPHFGPSPSLMKSSK